MIRKTGGVVVALLVLLVFAWPRYSQAQEKSGKAVFVHMMISFATKDVSGYWEGWNHSNPKVKHFPDVIKKDGTRDIASVYYPVIGPYDMTDPHLVEYHTQLMKMTGIDGAVFDLGFFIEPNTLDQKRSNFALRSAQQYIQYFKQYGLKGVVLFEDKAQWLWNGKLTTRDDTVAAAFKDLDNWLGMFRDVSYQIEERPLLLIYSYDQLIPVRGQSRLSSDELHAWKKQYPKRTRPIVLSNEYSADYYGVHEGVFQWPQVVGKAPAKSDCTFYNDLATEEKFWKLKDTDLQERMDKGEFEMVCGTVWPGLDDAGCMSWGNGHKVIPRLSGEMYAYHWKRVMDMQYPLVLIATWNDWFEGLNIEPTKEFGYQYLELTHKYIGQWKGQTVATGNLKIPEWIYKIRKNAQGSEKALNAAEQACKAIKTGDYQQAEVLIKPFVKVLNLE